MQNELEDLFEELNSYLDPDAAIRNRKMLIKQWQRYNDWLAEEQRINLDVFLKRIIYEQRATKRKGQA